MMLGMDDRFGDTNPVYVTQSEPDAPDDPMTCRLLSRAEANAMLRQMAGGYVGRYPEMIVSRCRLR